METCVICLEPISPEMGMVDCNHTFCLPCIQRWTDTCSACPICRADITIIRHFYRSFFMGDETRVPHKQQAMPIPDDTLPDDDDSDHFISDEIVYESQVRRPIVDAHCGTAWHRGQRVSLRPRPKNDFYRQFRSQLREQKQNQFPRIRPLGRRSLLDSFLEPEPDAILATHQFTSRALTQSP
jgi:hypothetical protein